MTDKLKMLNKLATNYLKMLNEESCELIKIKFWGGIEEQIKNLNLDNQIVVKFVIEEILTKNLEILTNKNLLFCIVTFLCEKSNKAYSEGFYQILMKFIHNYEENQIYFRDYLGDLATNILFNNLELEENCQKEIEFFFNMIEIDYELFNDCLQNKIEANKLYDCNKDFTFYFTNNNFLKIFNFFITKALKMKNVECLMFFFEKIENLKINSENFECLIKFNENLLKTFIQFINYNYDTNFQKTLILTLKTSKHVQNILNYGFSRNQINSEELSELYKILDEFILVMAELIHSNRKLTFAHLEIFLKFYDNKIPSLERSKNYLLSLLLSYKEQIYDTTSLIIFLKFLNKYRLEITNEDVNIIIAQIISNSLNTNYKMKYQASNKISSANKDILFVTQIKNEKVYSIPELESDYNIGSFYNLSNFKLVFYFVENCFDLNLNEKNCEVTLYEENLLAILKTLNSLNLELYDLNFQNFLFKFIFECLYVFYLFPLKAQSEKIDLRAEIFELLFKNLKKISNKSFLKNEIYPIVINSMQSILIPNYNLISRNESHLPKKEDTSAVSINILDYFFNFLFDLSRDDNIANLTSKLIMSLYNMKLTDLYSNKVYALNKFVELVVLTNSSKVFGIYFNFVLENMKLTSTDNNYSLYLLYDSLYKYSVKYEGALQSVFFEFVFAKLEKNLEVLPDEFSFDTLFCLNAIYNILIKDQPETLISKLYDYFHQTKFLKIFDKIFKIFTNGVRVPKLDENNYWEILSSIDPGIKTEHINKNLQEYNVTNLVLNKKINSEHILIGILLTLSKLFSRFVSNIIVHNKNSFDMKNLSDPNNKTIVSLIKTFDYITNAILLTNEASVTFTPYLLFLNEVFSYIDNLIFFYDIHSNFTAINMLQQNNLDYSFLNEINMKIVRDKNKVILDYIMSGENYIYLLKNLFNNIISYETNVINLLESQKGSSQDSNQMSSFVIDSLFDNSNILNLAKENTNLNENKKLNSFFTKMFLGAMTKLCDVKQEDIGVCLKINHSIYHVLLMHNIFLKYFKGIHHLINLDLVSLNFYNVVKTWKTNDILKHFLQFLFYFMKTDKNIFLFTLRICLNKNILNKVLVDNITQNVSNEMIVVIEFLVMQLLFFNSYKNDCLNYISTMLRNIQSLCFNFHCLSEKRPNTCNILGFGRILTKIYSFVKCSSFDGKNVINKKFKENLIQILNEEFLMKYLQDTFVNSFDLKDKENVTLIKNNLTNLMENFDSILILKELKVFSDNNQVKDNIESTGLNENVLFKNIILFDEFSFPMQLNSFLINYSVLIVSKDEKEKLYLYLIENYLLYQISVKNAQSKLIFDVTKTLLFNKTFSNSNNCNVIKWEDKFKFISMLLLNLLNDCSVKQSIFRGKSENFKLIGSILHVNLIKKLNIAKAMFINVNNEAMDFGSPSFMRYYSWIRNSINK